MTTNGPADNSGFALPTGPVQPAEETAFLRISGCWKTIGVLGGNQTCSELKRFVHCRNCPVYAEAGVKLLDRALPAGYRELWTRRLANRKADITADKKSVVIFRIGNDWLALPTPVFQEVTEARVIHSLPHKRDSSILGVVNVRGELLTCFSLARLLGLEVPQETTPQGQTAERMLVVGWSGHRQAFPVHEVFGVHRYLPQEAKTSSPFAVGAKFTRGQLEWEEHMVGLLDEEQLFNTFSQQLA